MNKDWIPAVMIFTASVISAPAVEQLSDASTKQIPGWGKAVDPAGDCKFESSDSSLVITVPGSDTPHDLSAELASSTAPRVLQEVKGDFTIEVKVEGTFAPGGESTQQGRTGYTGAGLVVFADDKNYVRLERATLHRPGGNPHAYTNFELRVDGELQRMGTTGDLPTEPEKPTWLRLERKGDKLWGAMSHDGETWQRGEPKDLPEAAWKGDEVVAGVAAISTSRETFAPVYSALKIQQGAGNRETESEVLPGEP